MLFHQTSQILVHQDFFNSRTTPPSFRRKPESIFAFAFSPPRSDVFAPGPVASESNTNEKQILWIPHLDATQVRGRGRTAGEKSKWIPAFAGMTAKTENQTEAPALTLKTNPPYPPLSGG